MSKKFNPNHCKTQIKLAISRIKLQKNKKDNNVKNQKREIAQLLKSGKEESARIKVESVIREDFIIEAYEILELFLELILARLGMLQISKECPGDIKEAICTVIYAAPRADIKELAEIRTQFSSKFGREFALKANQNTDNCVNARVVHKLGIHTPENYLVFQYLNEIAKSHDVDWHSDTPAPANLDKTAEINFPEPPNATGGGNSNFHFPDPPGAVGGGSSDVHFPDPPTASGGNHNFQFPTPPSGGNATIPSEPDIPAFDPRALPGGSVGGAPPSFPAFPSVNSSNNPIPPGFSSGGSGSGFPDFPTPPTSGSTASDLPIPPSGGSGSGFPDFPTPPTSGSTASDFPTLPPSGSSGFPDFPTPPATDNASGSGASGDGVPDFDELTARFEKLKRR